MLEEVTADTKNLGPVEVTVSVGLLETTIDDVVGNETVSFKHVQKFASLTQKFANFCTKILLPFVNVPVTVCFGGGS